MTKGEEYLTQRNLRDMLSHACDKAGGQAEWARQNKVGQPVVSDTLKGKRSFGPAILTALGLMRVERYIRIKP